MTPTTSIPSSVGLVLASLLLTLFPIASVAQEADTLEAGGIDEKLHRIFTDDEFDPEEFGPARWQDAGKSHTTLQPSDTVPDSPAEQAPHIARSETESGSREVIIPAARLVPEGRTRALEIEDYTWSEDKKRLMV